MFLSDFKIPERIQYSLGIDARVTQDGSRPFMLSQAAAWLKKKRGLDFVISHRSVPLPFSVKWKIKNTGSEAEEKDALRGEIIDDLGGHTRHESTLYEGEHYVECYVIKDGVCVAKAHLEVPIGRF